MPSQPTHKTSRFSEINLGIVCPMANEEALAAQFVNELLDVCQAAGFASVRMFVVLDKASKDNTLQILRELEKHRSELQVVWAPEDRSVVDAYLRGYREAIAADCDWILEIDAGYSHQPADAPQFFAAMAAGNDCVFGSRFCKGGRMTSSFKRRIVSRGGTALANLLLGTRMKDMTSGFELFSRATLQGVLDKGIHSRAHFFQTEIRAHCRNLHFAEVPIRYRVIGNSVNRSALTDAWINLGRLFRLRLAGRL
jgi:dolichol-phosphate mannosyltransferase